MPADFLMQQMAWREALDEAGDAQASRRARAPRSTRTRRAAYAALAQLARRAGDFAAAAQQVQSADVHRALRRTTSTSASTALEALTRWPCCRSPNPAQSPDPHQRRIAVGIDLGTTHSLVAAVRNGVAECLPDAQGRVHPALGGALPRRRPARRSAATRSAGAAERPEQHHRLGQAPDGPRAGRHRRPRQAALPTSSTTPGMVRARRRAHGVKSPVEVSAEILATLRQRAEDTFDDELFGAVDHRAGVLRRRPAPGHQGRGASSPA